MYLFDYYNYSALQVGLKIATQQPEETQLLLGK